MAVFVALASVAYSVFAAQKAKRDAKRAMARASGMVVQGRGSVENRRIIYGKKRVGALECYFATSGDKNQHLWYIMIWGEGPVEGVDIYFDDTNMGAATADCPAKFAGVAEYGTELGAPDQVASNWATTWIPGWTSTDRLLGIAYSVIHLSYNEDKYPQGVPNISGVVTGRNDIYDPRTSTSGWTDNVALCLNHFLKLQKTGPGMTDERINQDQLITAANVCDQSVPLLGGGYEKRYTFNGVVVLGDSTEDIISDFRTAMAGLTLYTGRQWFFFPGVYVEPTFEIDEQNLVAPPRMSTRESKRQRLNTVRGTFCPSSTGYQPTSFPPVQSGVAVLADQEELSEEVELLHTDSPSMCQRIAKITLMKTRFSRQLNVTCSIEALRAQPGYPVSVHLPHLGFYHTPMDVNSFELAIADGAIQCRLSLRETNPAVFAWSVAEEKGLLIGTTAPVNPPDPGTGNSQSAVYGNLLFSSFIH